VVVLVGLGVMDVIEAVDAAGSHAEGKEHQDAGNEIVSVKEMAVKEQGKENKQVLDQLLRAE
jgi:hypothetical protein